MRSYRRASPRSFNSASLWWPKDLGSLLQSSLLSLDARSVLRLTPPQSKHLHQTLQHPVEEDTKFCFLRMRKLFPEVHQETFPHQLHIPFTGTMTHAMFKANAVKRNEITQMGLGFPSEQEIKSTFLNDWYLYKHQIVLSSRDGFRYWWLWYLIQLTLDWMATSYPFVYGQLGSHARAHPGCQANLWMCLRLDLVPTINLVNCGQETTW